MIRHLPPSLVLLLTLGWLALPVCAATYTYETIDPDPTWNATHLFVRGMNDVGQLVASRKNWRNFLR